MDYENTYLISTAAKQIGLAKCQPSLSSYRQGSTESGSVKIVGNPSRNVLSHSCFCINVIILIINTSCHASGIHASGSQMQDLQDLQALQDPVSAAVYAAM